jgi:hypothetical protein
MPVWPKDTTAAKIAFYGDFHAANWHQVFLTRVTPMRPARRRLFQHPPD